ncbi:MAG: amidohydrolase family protein [Chloroflexi bacterium]|nr:amidohydrolase family protein [Chloroflexota bacterium]
MTLRTIDFHTHTHPTAEAGVAFQRLWGYDAPERNGSPAELLPLMDRASVARTMIIPWMPAQDHYDRLVLKRSEEGNPLDGNELTEAKNEIIESWRDLNQWAVEAVAAQPDRLMCLVGLDPIFMGDVFVREETADKLAKGACGLKIAPMFLRATPDDPRIAIVFELAREHGVFVLSQSGAHGYTGNPAWGHPRHFEAVLKAYPEVDIVLAHLGLGAEEEVARLTAVYPNLYADTSMRLHLLGQPGQWSLEEAVHWFRRIGVDRVIFGTNYPLCDPVQFAEVMEALPLTPDERRAVLFENAERVLTK